jgi:hypothetical protein
VKAAELSLSEHEMSQIEAAFPIGAAQGTRYPEAVMSSLGR